MLSTRSIDSNVSCSLLSPRKTLNNLQEDHVDPAKNARKLKKTTLNYPLNVRLQRGVLLGQNGRPLQELSITMLSVKPVESKKEEEKEEKEKPMDLKKLRLIAFIILV